MVIINKISIGVGNICVSNIPGLIWSVYACVAVHDRVNIKMHTNLYR